MWVKKTKKKQPTVTSLHSYPSLHTCAIDVDLEAATGLQHFLGSHMVRLCNRSF